MSKRAFGKYYYSMENSYKLKSEAQKAAREIKAAGKYLVRVAPAGFGKGSEHKWAVYLRRK